MLYIKLLNIYIFLKLQGQIRDDISLSTYIFVSFNSYIKILSSISNENLLISDIFYV